ncbi:chromatin structure-remodeling complex protein-like protein rsc1 [Mytilinidion resinicola]|uniref:Chromatin structure-remodeling complex protein-like protein rsc1 n=1 Tax=Mytilinidion resinicola TaxID=574789 RepID=A0A6A6Z1R4_9PEZI|nr:chromatin structure-remodeling complex protein-like protein rsc1 [Mytilinidion resinicola]KAF2814177.1 chromatin structure-remodeling complex protein-like protein rsc1 [Mytilinidion resinicola]
MAAKRAESDTPIPSTETNQVDGGSSIVTEDEWKGMSTVMNAIYGHRMEDGYDPSKIFQRKVNKRAVPDYYDVIKEPMALSIIKQKIGAKEYKSFQDFVRDCALVPYNAQVYNLANSQAYQDALEVKGVLESELKKLVDEKVITEEVGTLPYIGEIPDPDQAVAEEDEEEDEEDDEEDDEDGEGEGEGEDSEDDGKRKRKRGVRSTAAIAKREGGAKAKEDPAAKANDPESRKKRGRPPRVDTPMEARIKAIMKGIRKPRNSLNKLMVSHFERVPDKAAMPEYHQEIKTPMAMDLLKRKLKRKKYNSVDQFMQDVELMFENAKQYNEDDSQVYKDAVHLQKEARVIAQQEKEKPDNEYVMEEGRLPMPNGILHNGELWKVGDWIHIQNANDLTKPIVAQIYRTWQDAEGGKWVNACWYYRPEQTIHRFDRHFLENEVVKTGQYRDHPIDEVVDRCFVMFFTRYNKGRPRDFPADKEIYVCEARYNEEKHKLNKIKTWASCLPDEVRDKDYVMDLFDAPRKLKKVPSPIAYLLKDDQKETDDLPKPEWGAENAPPKIGAVHRRPRDPKESPPPEPTPTPPPQPPPPPPRQISSIPPPATNGYSNESRMDYAMGQPSGQTPIPAPTPQPQHIQPSYTPQQTQQYNQHSASPVPPMQHMPASQPSSFAAITPHLPFATPQPTHHMAQYATPQTQSLYQQNPVRAPPLGYKTPQPVEVYHLNDHANANIPLEIRQQFHCDEQGHVLFFTAPPIDPQTPPKEGAALGHSARYLAAKKKREALLAARRKAEEAERPEKDRLAKRKREEDDQKFQKAVGDLRVKAMKFLENQLAEATAKEYQVLFNGDVESGVEATVDRLAEMQQTQAERNKAMAERKAKDEASANVPIRGLNVTLDEST